MSFDFVEKPNTLNLPLHKSWQKFRKKRTKNAVQVENKATRKGNQKIRKMNITFFVPLDVEDKGHIIEEQVKFARSSDLTHEGDFQHELKYNNIRE